MNYEDEMDELLTAWGTRRDMTFKFLAKSFKLNRNRTLRVLSSILGSQVSEDSRFNNRDLIPHRKRLIAELKREFEAYQETRKFHELYRLEAKKKKSGKAKNVEVEDGDSVYTSKLLEEKDLPMLNEPHENKKMPGVKLIGHYK
mgnify:CR=1 FL=1